MMQKNSPLEAHLHLEALLERRNINHVCMKPEEHIYMCVCLSVLQMEAGRDTTGASEV